MSNSGLSNSGLSNSGLSNSGLSAGLSGFDVGRLESGQSFVARGEERQRADETSDFKHAFNARLGAAKVERAAHLARAFERANQNADAGRIKEAHAA